MGGIYWQARFLNSRRACVAALGLALAAVAGCSDSAKTDSGADAGATAADAGSADAADDGKITLVMIPKASQHTFWNHVREGAERAAQELGVELIWKGPAADNDRAEQIKVVQQFTNESVDGILLAPTDGVALADSAHTAMARGIPVLIFDSGIEGQAGVDYVAFVATDNEAAGRLGGKHLMELIGKGGKAVLFRHMEGHASTGAREDGALAEFKAAGAEILVDNRYSGPTMTEAQQTALNMIDVLREANGIFASNQTAAEGMLLALEQRNLAGKVKFVGFDSSDLLVQGLKDKHIDALVVQDPVNMGYKSVQMMVDHLHGKKIDETVNTEVHLVTPENMNDPEIAALLK